MRYSLQHVHTQESIRFPRLYYTLMISVKNKKDYELGGHRQIGSFSRHSCSANDADGHATFVDREKEQPVGGV